MDDAIARFHRRRDALALSSVEANTAPVLYSLTCVESESRTSRSVSEIMLAAPAHDPSGADELLASLAAQFDDERFSSMVGGIKMTVLQNIAGPFGLGKLVSIADKVGGNVDTVHNARAGVYANDLEEQRYAERGEYDAIPYHTDPRFKSAGEAAKTEFEQGKLADAYTGETFKPSAIHDKQLRPSIDHIISAKTTHDDAGRLLAGSDSVDLASMQENFAVTAKTLNSSKQNCTPKKYAAYLVKTATSRQERVAKLEAGKATWTDAERNEYKKLAAQERVNIAALKKKGDEAQAAIDARINRDYYLSGKFAGAVAATGVKEGAKAGLQQAVGVALIEFFAAAFDEVQDIYRHGMQEDSFAAEAKLRLRAIARRVASKWEAVLGALRSGFIGGLLSNIVTALVNAFVTTGKRMVRIIREGAISLVRAIGLIVFRPASMSKREALHEASKLVVAAGVVSVGVMLEEVLSKALGPYLGPLADPVTAAVIGSITAVATTFAVYLLDKADFFKVNALARELALGKMLDDRLMATAEQTDVLYATVMSLPGS